MFRFFSRKSDDNSSAAATQGSQQAGARDTAHSLQNQQLRTPSPSVTSAIGKNNSNLSPLNKPGAQEPPITPSPPPDGLLGNELGLITDPAALHSLISSIPPKILHEYTLSHLIPPARSSKPIHPPSSLTLTHLTSFFSSLTPPPQLHCVRCHKSFYEVENGMRSCLVPHDDESAEVERAGGRAESQYQTLWGCCGKTVEGDGDMGPPDGWCYEGKHTTDTKRARFRADSTVHDDKLTSCDRLKCHEPPVSDAESSSSAASSPRPRKRKRSTRKREEVEEQAEIDAVDDDDDARSVTSTRSQTRMKKLKSSASSASLASKPRKKRAKTSADDKAFKPEATPSEDEDMDVDDGASVVSTKSKRTAKSAKPKSSAGEGKGKAKGTTTKPVSRRKNASSVPPASVSAPSSPVRASPAEHEKPRKPNVTFQTMEDGPSKSKGSSKPRSSAKGRSTKRLEDVVATSVEGEM